MSDESLDKTVADAGISPAFISFKDLPESGPVREFFATKQKHRSYGSGFLEPLPNPELYVEDVKPLEVYDGLFYIDQTTSSIRNPGGTYPQPVTLKKLANPGFEQDQMGQLPFAWQTNRYRMNDFGFDAKVTDSKAAEGKQSLKLSRLPGKHYGATYANVFQRVEAKEFRGKKLKFSAKIMLERKSELDFAYLSMSIKGKNQYSAPELASDKMYDRPVSAENWQTVEIVLDVDEKAEFIDLSLIFTGEGAAWFDDIRLTAM